MILRWEISIASASGAPVEQARIALCPDDELGHCEITLRPVEQLADSQGGAPVVPGQKAAHGASMMHTGKGHYIPIRGPVPKEGNWVLVVQAKGFSPIVQPLRMTTGPEHRLLPRDPKQMAATIALSATETRRPGADPIRRTVFALSMFPTQEVVLLNGTQYEPGKGVKFFNLAKARREGLRRSKQINKGALVTHLDCDDRSIITYVQTRRRDYMPIVGVSFGATDGINPGQAHKPVPLSDAESADWTPERYIGSEREDPSSGTDVSILDFYRYLDSVGRADPGRVVEASILSHAWVGGPVLYNTDDESGHHGSQDPRDPDDFDGRRKDFFSPSLDGWPEMKKAFASDGAFRVWGCWADSHLRQMILNSAKREKQSKFEELFTIKTSTRQERTRAALVPTAIQIQAVEAYSGAAAMTLGIAVLAPPPGVGSSFIRERPARGRDLVVMQVSRRGKTNIPRSDPKKRPADMRAILRWYDDHFGEGGTNVIYDRGYLDYQALTGTTLAPVDFAAGFFRRTEQKKRVSFQWMGGIGFDFPTDVGPSMTSTPSSAFSKSGRPGFVYEIRNGDGGLLKALFVEDGPVGRPLTPDETLEQFTELVEDGDGKLAPAS